MKRISLVLVVLFVLALPALAEVTLKMEAADSERSAELQVQRGPLGFFLLREKESWEGFYFQRESRTYSAGPRLQAVNGNLTLSVFAGLGIENVKEGLRHDRGKFIILPRWGTEEVVLVGLEIDWQTDEKVMPYTLFHGIRQSANDFRVDVEQGIYKFGDDEHSAIPAVIFSVEKETRRLTPDPFSISVGVALGIYRDGKELAKGLVLVKHRLDREWPEKGLEALEEREARQVVIGLSFGF